MVQAMVYTGTDPRVDKDLEEILGRPISQTFLDTKLGNGRCQDAHLRTRDGEDLYFKAVETAVPYVQAGQYTPQSPRGYVFSSDIGQEMLSLGPQNTTLLVIANSNRLMEYALPDYNGHLTLNQRIQIPFDQHTTRAMFVFDPNEARAVEHAISENPSNTPAKVLYMTKMQFPELKGLDRQAHEIEFGTTEGRLALWKSIGAAERLVLSYLQNL